MGNFSTQLFRILLFGSIAATDARLRRLQNAPTQPSSAWPSTTPAVNETVSSPEHSHKPCHNGINISSHGNNTFVHPPIEILKSNGAQVVFSFAQTWNNSVLCRVAVDYSSASSDGAMVCDVRTGVAPGEVGVYRAVCEAGVATVTVYGQDDSVFSTYGHVDSVPERCAPVRPGFSTVAHTIQIPCRVDPDCSNDEPTCVSGSRKVVIGRPENFNDGNIDGWLFGSVTEKNGNKYLAPGVETVKTFAVPSTADSVTVAFKVWELKRYSELVVRVGDTLIDLGAKYDCEVDDTMEGYAGDIQFQSTPISIKINQVQFVVPSGWFRRTGRLTIGFVASTVGIDDWIMTADCSAGGSGTNTPSPPTSRAPTSAPSRSECLPQIELLDGALSDFERLPLEILEYAESPGGVVDDVVFGASQAISDATLCRVAVDYPGGSTSEERRCAVVKAVPPGEFGVYRAQCVDGYANVSLHVQDASLESYGTNGTAIESIPDRCAPLTSSSYTRTYNFRLSCRADPSCPPSPYAAENLARSSSMCVDFHNPVLYHDTFHSTPLESPHGWWFGRCAQVDGGCAWAPAGRATIRTMTVPRDAAAISVALTLAGGEVVSGRWSLRVNAYQLILDAEEVVAAHDNGTVVMGYWGDIELHRWQTQYLAKSDEWTSTRLELVIPTGWYARTGRLTLGLMQNDGDNAGRGSWQDAGTAAFGFTDVRLEAICA